MSVLDCLLFILGVLCVLQWAETVYEKNKEKFIDEASKALKKTKQDLHFARYANAPTKIKETVIKMASLNYMKVVDILLSTYNARIFYRNEFLCLFGEDFIMDIERDDVLKALSEDDQLVKDYIAWYKKVRC